VILVSFGSIVSSLPKEIVLLFLAAFDQIEQDVIWRMEKGDFSVPQNVLLQDWLPQNDLLADPKVLLFITHCGKNGQFEALYHGKPMIGFPIMADQRYNARRAEYKGYGLMMEVMKFKSEELVHNIKTLLTDPAYTQNIQKASRIFHSRPDTPAERSAWWIEHVMEFGSDHLRPYTLQMPWYQFWMVDIIGLAVLVMVVVILACIGLIWVVIGCVKKCLRKKEDKIKLQ
jgi:UDP:flavonoid glycosyltransferase YjiC (YdhE family)